MWHWRYDETLFALYGLDEVERVDGLLEESTRLRAAFLDHYGTLAPKELEKAQRQHLAKLRAGESRDSLSATTMKTLLQFPGMRDYRKKVS